MWEEIENREIKDVNADRLKVVTHSIDSILVHNIHCGFFIIKMGCYNCLVSGKDFLIHYVCILDPSLHRKKRP